MKTLIKSAKIIDPNSPYNNQVKSILISNGSILEIGDDLSSEGVDTIVEHSNLHICPGLMDTHSNLCDPGDELKEDLISGANAAAAGGFTDIAIMPNTTPPTSNKSGVQYIINSTQHHPVKVHPIGALSKDIKGEELAEMYDMKQAGAIAFSDGKKPVKNAGLMSRALLYSKNFDGLIMSFAYDKDLAHNGQMHEGEMSTKLGLEGIPPLAEEIQISRDLFLTAYNGGRIHFSTISTMNTVDIIKEAKSEGLEVSCEVSAHQLLFMDQDLNQFESIYKVMPPFREEMDANKLIEGLKDGTIDVICSDHYPQDTEAKEQEFERSEFGVLGLQTAFPLACTLLEEHIGLEGVVQKMSINPRSILKLEIPIIQEGHEAKITLFDPTQEWTFEEKDILSKSKNSPIIGKKLKCKVVGIINGKKGTV